MKQTADKSLELGKQSVQNTEEAVRLARRTRFASYVSSGLVGGTAGGLGVYIGTHDALPTALLQAWGRGEVAALDRLLPLVHGELRRLAGRHMRHERIGHTLQASALVNEAYLRSRHAGRRSTSGPTSGRSVACSMNY